MYVITGNHFSCSFESWFDITSLSETAEDIIAKEREQNVLHMLHQVLTFSYFAYYRLRVKKKP